MKQWSITLEVDDLRIPLSIEAPVNYAPIEDYREVNFSIPGKGPYLAVFWLLPDRNSDNPYTVMRKTEWGVPVRWDDNTMLFLRSTRAVCPLTRPETRMDSLRDFVSKR